MFNKKDFDYYQKFVELVEYNCRAADLLCEIVYNYDLKKAQTMLKSMHDVEHEADMQKHTLVNKLIKEFITPIDREDIINLSQEIDDVTDNIEDVLIKIYMYNIKTIRKGALDFTDIIKRCCEALRKTFIEFHNFSRSKTIKGLIIEVNDLEEEGDKLFVESMNELFASDADAVEKLVWKSIFENLEKCCDSCEHVANIVETTIMKNS
ncbi:MAG TPA: DUF47 family protein [Clostridia bacterium]|nr:DUF47 family protein [Clostridia bacterium]